MGFLRKRGTRQSCPRGSEKLPPHVPESISRRYAAPLPRCHKMNQMVGTYSRPVLVSRRTLFVSQIIYTELRLLLVRYIPGCLDKFMHSKLVQRKVCFLQIQRRCFPNLPDRSFRGTARYFADRRGALSFRKNSPCLYPGLRHGRAVMYGHGRQRQGCLARADRPLRGAFQPLLLCTGSYHIQHPFYHTKTYNTL